MSSSSDDDEAAELAAALALSTSATTAPEQAGEDSDDADDDAEALKAAMAMSIAPSAAAVASTNSDGDDGDDDDDDDDDDEDQLAAAMNLSLSGTQEDVEAKTTTKPDASSSSSSDDEMELAAALSLSHKKPAKAEGSGSGSSSAAPSAHDSFKALHASLVASGMDPTAAAAVAIRQLQAEQAQQSASKRSRPPTTSSGDSGTSTTAAAAASPGKAKAKKKAKVSSSSSSSSSSPPAAVTFRRLERREAVAREQLAVINALYRSDGVVFIDDQFAPTDTSLYSSPKSATTWKCRACSARNPLPPKRDGQRLWELMRSPGSSTIKCGTCGSISSELEVACRPSRWMAPAFVRDDITLQESTQPWVVIRGDPRPDDIRQGGVGNCWLVCALSVLAEKPKYIRKILLTQEFNPAGAYQVRLCQAGTWHTVTIDHTLPVTSLGLLAYLKAARRSLWGPLIEKAAAKLWGSYEALAGGTFAEAFAMLTGFPVQTIRIAQLREPRPRDGFEARLAAMPDEAQRKAVRAEFGRVVAKWKAKHGSEEESLEGLYAQLLSYKTSGYVMGASTFAFPGQEALVSQARALGVQIPHAYGILDIVTLEYDPVVDGVALSRTTSTDSEGGASEARPATVMGSSSLSLVKLRNPNGHAGWKGAWAWSQAARDKRWTAARRRQLGIEREDAGVFWMAWDDFCKYFVEITVCKLLDGFQEARLPGWLPSRFGPGEALAINVYAHTKVELSGTQEAHLDRGEASQKTLLDLGVAVMKCETSNERTIATLAAPGTPAASRRPYGRLVARAERVFHGAGASCSATLEHDDVPSTRYVLMPLCFGHMRSTEPRKFVLAVHSPAPLTIETIPLSTEMLRAAIIATVVEHGDRHPFLSLRGTDLLVFHIMEDQCGYCIVVENLSPFHYFNVEFDAGANTKGYVSSRGGSKFCQDVVPPRSRQLLMVLSIDMSVKDHKLGYRMNAIQLPNPAAGASVPITHMPPLDSLGELRGLHAAEPITDVPIPALFLQPQLPAASNVDTGGLAADLMSRMGIAPAPAPAPGAISMDLLASSLSSVLPPAAPPMSAAATSGDGAAAAAPAASAGGGGGGAAAAGPGASKDKPDAGGEKK